MSLTKPELAIQKARRSKILAHLQNNRATASDIASLLEIPHMSAASLMTCMLRAGLIKGKYTSKKTRAGNREKLYYIGEVDDKTLEEETIAANRKDKEFMLGEVWPLVINMPTGTARNIK